MGTVKLFIVFPLVFLFCIESFAQELSIEKGDMIADIGIGYHPIAYNNFQTKLNDVNSASNEWAYSTGDFTVAVPTFSVVFQKAWFDDVTIGVQFSFNAFNYSYTSTTSGGQVEYASYLQNNTFLDLRGEYHFNRSLRLNSKCDFYAGALVGMASMYYSNADIYTINALGDKQNYAILHWLVTQQVVSVVPFRLTDKCRVMLNCPFTAVNRILQ